MENLKNEIEKIVNLSTQKNQIEELKNQLKEKETELNGLNQEVQLTMIGTIDREIKNEQVEKASKEFDDIKQNKEQSEEKLKEEFNTRKTSLVSAIDAQMSKYKRKNEIEQLKSQKSAYEKVAENAQKTIDKALEDFNEGKQINQTILNNAREELKVNKDKAEELRK